MLSIDKISNDKDETLKGLEKRGFKNLGVIDEIIELNNSRKKIQQELDQFLFESNTISKEIAEIFKSGNKSDDVENLKSKSTDLKAKSKDLSDKLDKIKSDILSLITTIPNLPDSDVPDGLTINDNLEVFSSGEIKDTPDNLKNHWNLAKDLDIIDFELGSKITGSGFPVYKGKGAKLQRALINFFLDRNTSAGYTEFQVPHLVNSESAFATGQLPDKDDQMYHVNNDDFYLIPTAEVPLTNIYRDNILSIEELPILLTGYTPCFRREAGSYGSDVRGLNRLHQFDKVEIVRLEHPENSSNALSGMKEHIKGILNELELDFRILNLCAGDLGFTSSITYDFELYSKGQKKWLEISSVSNFKTYQSNRLNLKFKNKDGKNQLLHTLNGSSLALPRVMAGLIENNQSKDGIKIPKVLVPFTGFDIIN
ncbi:serine--tRNA ligase [Flavobacteriaceae bacterium]|jgi:seryl-tRNA synthetase|nr:serine--tRNA ligase [Cryomorphaceae bacterium]MDB3967586.1 serine--tRNA ligase [Flavobacteriaceae bacterium]MBT3502902.1 serine--tRNA ligase [Cryomorphaceae bacterium]MBT3688847.1 serine--tRNA ligase [Cryomorphaceae bacterium]MBT4221963.1 serine--tRNA ligase [Cryomorphaceae bacterium]